MKRLAVLLALGIAGCGGMKMMPEERVVFRDGPAVEVPKPVYCTPKVDPRPDYPDTDEALRAAAGHIDAQVGLLLAGRHLRGPYEAEIEQALHDCGGPPQQ